MMSRPPDPGAHHLVEKKARGSRFLHGASAFMPWLFQRVPEALQEARRGNVCYRDSAVSNAEHAFFVCAKWGIVREAAGQAVDAKITPNTMVPLMLQFERIWTSSSHSSH